MKKPAILAASALLLTAVILGPPAAHHFLPPTWTGEAGRLATILEAREGAHVAEIGAGSGAMARAMARLVGPGGRLYVTEMSSGKRDRLTAMARDEGLTQVAVVAAAERGTNLPASCCSAIYMRNVLHHIEDWRGYAVDLVRTVRPGGIVAIIDFPPGAFFHLARDHGAEADRVVEAFVGAGLRLERRDNDWGGGTFLLAFRRVE